MGLKELNEKKSKLLNSMDSVDFVEVLNNQPGLFYETIPGSVIKNLVETNKVIEVIEVLLEKIMSEGLKKYGDMDEVTIKIKIGFFMISNYYSNFYKHFLLERNSEIKSNMFLNDIVSITIDLNEKDICYIKNDSFHQVDLVDKKLLSGCVRYSEFISGLEDLGYDLSTISKKPLPKTFGDYFELRKNESVLQDSERFEMKITANFLNSISEDKVKINTPIN